MRHLSLAVLSAALFCMTVCSCGRNAESDVVAEEVETGGSSRPFDADSLLCVEGTVGKGQFFSTLLGDLGMSASDAYDLTLACDSIFDVRTLRVGNTYHAYYAETDSSRTLKYLVYDRDRESQIVFGCCPPYHAEVRMKPVEVVSGYADVTITTSLWNDMIAADVSPLLILSLSDIYAWTVDFFGLQKGDRFRVLYSEKRCDGEVIAIDSVRYAVFQHGSDTFPMIMFDRKDGGNVWWNDKGESMRKAFLKAPLKYSRISSGFSYARRHPVTRRVQPHTGVDYAAPTGTPVMSIGDGTVTSVKHEGAGGKTVRIKHNSVYSTAYLHLSKYASGIAPGKRVRQGDVIGYVGSTGRSTGPHLDFRVWKNGKPINPLTMDSPPAEPLPAALIPEFNQVHAKYRAEADSLRALDFVVELRENM